MDSRVETEEVRALCKVIADLADDKEASSFLEDLCTVKEIQELAQRLHVARMLDAGAPYTAISEKTGASATTIARVSKALNYGAGGYRHVIDKLGDL